MSAIAASAFRRLASLLLFSLPALASAQDTTPPSVPAGLTASDHTATTVKLSWTAATDNVAVTGYEVFRDGVSVGTTTATNITITGLTPLTAYPFTVRARDAASNWSPQSSIGYGRAWQRLHQLSGTIYYWEETDEEGNTTDSGYTQDSHRISPGGSIKVHATGTMPLSLTLWRGGVVGQTNGAPISYEATFQPIDIIVSASQEGDYQAFVDRAPTFAGLPTPSFVNGPAIGRAPLAVAFSDNGSVTPNGLIAAYKWDFDASGSIDATGSNVTHIYPNTGSTPITYTTRLTVVDSDGFSNSVDRTTVVYPASSFGIAVQSGTTSVPYQMSGSSVTLVAAAPGSGLQFSSWSLVSGSGTFANANAATTTFTTASSDTVVKANYVADTVAPTVPGGLAASNHTANALTISWTPSTDVAGVTAYEVFRNGISLGLTTTPSISVPGLTASTTYQFTVRAKDAADNWSLQSDVLHARTWQHLHSWGGTLTDTEELDENGNPTGNWISSEEFYNLSTSSAFRVYITGAPHLKLRVELNNGTLIGQNNTGAAISHTPSGYQHFNITVSDGSGDYQLYVDVPSGNLLPTANFTASSEVGRGSAAFAFNGASSVDPDGPAGSLTYGWDFDSNGTIDATGVTATRTYTNSGSSVAIYGVRLTVTDIVGGQHTIFKTVTVYPASAQGVVVQGGAPGTPYVMANGTVTLTAAAPDVGLAFLGWSLISGEGSITDPNAKVTTFTPSGTIDVVLKANYGTDISPPTAPRNLSVGNVFADSATLTWVSSLDNVGVVTYEIYNEETLVAATASNQVTVTGLTPATQHFFNVRAVDASGLRSTPSGSVVVATWDRLYNNSGAIQSHEGDGTEVVFEFKVLRGGTIRVYSTGSTPVQATLASPGLSTLERTGVNFSAIRQVDAGAYSITVSGLDGDVAGDFQVFVDYGITLLPDFSATPDAGSSPLTVTFNASKSFDPNGGAIASYEWDFNEDGATDATGSAISHTFGNGVFTPRLKITSTAGLTATMTRKIVTQNVPVFPTFQPSGSGIGIPAPGVIASPTSGRVGAQVTLTAPGADNSGALFYAWVGGLVDNIHANPTAVTLSPVMPFPTAIYQAGSSPIRTTYDNAGPGTARINQPFTIVAKSRAGVAGYNVVSNQIDYSTDYGATWITATLAAGTKWVGSQTEHILSASFSFTNPGWVFFRAQAAGVEIGGNPNWLAASHGNYTKVLIRTGNEEDTVVVLNGSGTPDGGPAGTVISLATLPGMNFCWWEIVSGSGTISNPYWPWPTFTKGPGPAIIRANPGTPVVLSVIKGQTNKNLGMAGTECQITADPPDGGSVFRRWERKTGAGHILDEYLPNTSFIMGEGGATIEAVYQPAGTPIIEIARSAAGVFRGSPVTITVSARDPAGNLSSIAIDHSVDEGRTWVAGSLTAQGSAQDPTRWEGTAVAKTIGARFLFLEPGRYHFRAHAVDAEGNVTDYKKTFFSVSFEKPETTIWADSDSILVYGSGDSTDSPELTVLKGRGFTITANSIHGAPLLSEQVIEYSKNGGHWEPGTVENNRLWRAIDHGGNLVAEIKRAKTFVSHELGAGLHRFRARAFDTSKYSDFQYVTVRVLDPVPPSILTPPSDVVATIGGKAVFTVTASGPPPLAYQWHKNGTPIYGATASSYTINAVQLADAGSFTVQISNGVGMPILSNAATLTINRPPTASFTATPSSGAAPLSIAVNAAASADADGSIISYEWDFGNGRKASGATASYTYMGLPAAKTYDVKLTVQ
ncbi:MAG: PKD domain-containing protein, partial [Verrucomicrobiota bacterium]